MRGKLFGLGRRQPAAPAPAPVGAAMREAMVDIDGKLYAIASDDEYLDYVKDGFEPHMVRLFRTLVTRQDVVLDVGANIGCTAILFAAIAKAVYAFEPSPSTFAILERNLARSGLTNATPLNFGLGSEPGDFPLTFGAWNRSGGYISNHTRASLGHSVETVAIRTMDAVVPDFGVPVQFIKLDVEGFEGHVLRGGAGTLAAHRPTVVLELNHWCLNAFQRTSLPDFFDLLRSLFPITLALDGDCYLDIRDESEAYTVMYQHILRNRFANILAAFDETRLRRFRRRFHHRFAG